MHIYEVLKRPILTEKTNYLADELHRYTFEVDRRANKQLVQRAVEEIFKVQVQRVNIMCVQGKTRRFGRLIGKTPEWKKAIVTLAPGDSISFFEGV
ncbi:MAG: 50S ribosomal protein L23 [Anaerolineae bacterium]|jgi:large subunit ribosomal protein L23